MSDPDSKEARRESVERQLEDTEPSAEQTASPAPEFEPAEGGVEGDGVEGEEHSSITRQGNEGEGEPGREETGTQGPTERPVGTSTERDQTSIDPDD